MADRPRLTIGLPVWNGERFLKGAVGALLNQSFDDFELIICDNGSTDGTIDICSRLMAADDRIRLLVRSSNSGAAANFNFVFSQCQTELFKWAAADDLHEPRYLERCVDALDADPTAALAHSRARSIAVDGSVMRSDWGETEALGLSDPAERFRSALAPPRNPVPLPMFAVMRTEILARTGLLLDIPDFDRALVAELALHGRFVEVPDTLFSHQEHENRMGHELSRDPGSAATQLGGGRRLPHWRLLGRHLESIRRRPAGVPAPPLLSAVGEWAGRHRDELADDAMAAGSRAPGVGSALAGFRRRRTMDRYNRQVDGFRAAVIDRVPVGEGVVVIDDDELVIDNLDGRPCTPLIPMDSPEGSYPARAEDAIDALTQRRSQGSTHLAIAWPAFWVLDYHRELALHLDRHHQQLLADDNVVLYRLTDGSER